MNISLQLGRLKGRWVLVRSVSIVTSSSLRGTQCGSNGIAGITQGGTSKDLQDHAWSLLRVLRRSAAWRGSGLQRKGEWPLRLHAELLPLLCLHGTR